MLEHPGDTSLIGVDGGATEVKAHEIVRSAATTLALGTASASVLYDRARGFRPVPMPTQMLALEKGAVQPSGLEGAQARLWLEATARTIAGVAEQSGGARFTVGICMPGLKTADGRGIAVMRRGPRIPDFLDRFEALLAERGIELARPVTRLSSDGEACAHGERIDAQGLLRGVGCAYYLGGGTGIAEALVIDGRVHGFDALAGFVRKAWQMEATGGRVVEDLLSPRGMNAAYAVLGGKRLPLRPGDLPEMRALAGDEQGAAVLRDAAEALSSVVLDRMAALRRGFQAGRITPNTFLDRVVIGQRLGAVFAAPELRPVFRDLVEDLLARKILATGDGALRKHYLDRSNLRPDLLAGSRLRAAPAIGAVAMELEAAARTDVPRVSAPWDRA
jgi:predicted NBD/HSP70 family sugar kinase